jgi:hypothetical protein
MEPDMRMRQACCGAGVVFPDGIARHESGLVLAERYFQCRTVYALTNCWWQKIAPAFCLLVLKFGFIVGATASAWGARMCTARAFDS